MCSCLKKTETGTIGESIVHQDNVVSPVLLSLSAPGGCRCMVDRVSVSLECASDHRRVTRVIFDQ
jgi:hypothetical protein